MLRSLALSALFGCVASLSLAAADGKPSAEWPQFRGPKRDGLSADKGLLKEWPEKGPPLVWKATGLGQGFSSISLVGGKIFTMGDKDGSSFVFAVNAADGAILWTSEKVGKAGGNYSGTRCTPTVDGDLVYALGQFGDLVCLECATGKERWRKNLPKDFKGTAGGWNYCESVLVDGDKLLCTPHGSEATILALNKKTGDVIWKSAVPDNGDPSYSSMVISEACGIRQYVQLLSNGVVGVRAKDGEFLWRYDGKNGCFRRNTANVPTPIVEGNHVFVSAGYGKGGGLIELSESDGKIAVKELYFDGKLNNRHGGVVHVGDYIYGDRDHGGQPWCADFKTGKIKWQNAKPQKGSGSAAITYAEGHLYCRYANGYVALVEASADGYQERGGFKIPNSTSNSWNHPVVIGGRLYLREKDVLWCYDVTRH
jgi:outer membrane protein assembly factor BamB